MNIDHYTYRVTWSLEDNAMYRISITVLDIENTGGCTGRYSQGCC